MERGGGWWKAHGWVLLPLKRRGGRVDTLCNRALQKCQALYMDVHMCVKPPSHPAWLFNFNLVGQSRHPKSEWSLCAGSVSEGGEDAGSCVYSDFTWGFVWTLEFPLDAFQILQAWLFSRRSQYYIERPWSGLELDFRLDLVVHSKQNIKGKNMVPNEWMHVWVCLSDASLSLP